MSHCLRVVLGTWEAEGGARAGAGTPLGGAKGRPRSHAFCPLSLDLLGDCSAPGAVPQCPPGPGAAEVAVSCALQVPPCQKGDGVWSRKASGL